MKKLLFFFIIGLTTFNSYGMEQEQAKLQKSKLAELMKHLNEPVALDEIKELAYSSINPKGEQTKTYFFARDENGVSPLLEKLKDYLDLTTQEAPESRDQLVHKLSLLSRFDLLGILKAVNTIKKYWSITVWPYDLILLRNAILNESVNRLKIDMNRFFTSSREFNPFEFSKEEKEYAIAQIMRNIYRYKQLQTFRMMKGSNALPITSLALTDNVIAAGSAFGEITVNFCGATLSKFESCMTSQSQKSTDAITALAASDDFLITGDQKGRLQLYKIVGSTFKPLYFTNDFNTIQTITLSGNNFVVSGKQDNIDTLMMFKIQPDAQKAKDISVAYTLSKTINITSLALDGRYIALGINNGTVTLRDLNDLNNVKKEGKNFSLQSVTSQPMLPVTSVVLKDDILVVAAKNSIYIFDINKPISTYYIKDASAIIEDVGQPIIALNATKNIVTATLQGGSIKIWDISKPYAPRYQQAVQSRQNNPLAAIYNDYLITAENTNKVILWEKKILTLPADSTLQDALLLYYRFNVGKPLNINTFSERIKNIYDGLPQDAQEYITR